jgi:hypothetical protein
MLLPMMTWCSPFKVKSLEWLTYSGSLWWNELNNPPLKLTAANLASYQVSGLANHLRSNDLNDDWVRRNVSGVDVGMVFYRFRRLRS